MGHQLTLELPDEIYEAVKKAADATGKTPTEWIVTDLRQRLPARDERLRRHFGSVRSGNPRSADNEQIDADLAKEYGSTHEEES